MAKDSLQNTESRIVLLIEDNVDDERLTLRSLRKNNIMNEVVVACDGEEALDYLFARGSYEGRNVSIMPSLLILDLKLPKLSGLEVLQEVRSNESTLRIPIVVLTSSASQEDIDACYEAGANSFVVKPTDPSDYSETVLQIAMYWLLLNRTPGDRLRV